MLSKFPLETSHRRRAPQFPATAHHKPNQFCRIVCCEKNGSSDSPKSSASSSSSSSTPDDKFGFKLVGQSLRDKNWKFNDIDAREFQNTCICSLSIYLCLDDLDFAAYGLWSNENWCIYFGLQIGLNYEKRNIYGAEYKIL